MDINPQDLEISHSLYELQQSLSPKLFEVMTDLIEKHPKMQVFIENHYTNEQGEHLSVYFMNFPPLIYDIVIAPDQTVTIF